MFLNNINIENKLLQTEIHSRSLNWICELLQDEKHTQQFTSVNKLKIDSLEQDKIVHEKTIRKICLDYRLRFVDLEFYKGSLPNEAQHAIINTEKFHDTKLHSFKILASAEVLNLKNYDDPILFVPIGNDYYYKIYRWGNDLHYMRKLYTFPMRSLKNLIITILIVSLITTIFIGFLNTSVHKSRSLQLISFLFILKSYIAIVLYYCVWKGKYVSEANWKSIYSNQ